MNEMNAHSSAARQCDGHAASRLGDCADHLCEDATHGLCGASSLQVVGDACMYD